MRATADVRSRVSPLHVAVCVVPVTLGVLITDPTRWREPENIDIAIRVAHRSA